MTQPKPSGVIARSRRGLWMLLAGAVVLAGVVSAGVWWSGRSAAPPPPMRPGIEDDEVRRAIEAARKEVMADPRSGSSWGYLGMVFLANLFDREADFCFAEAARLDPKEPRWPYGRGVIAQARDRERAPALLRQAAEAAESWPERRSDFWLRLAESLLEVQRTEEAEAVYLDVRRHHPSNARAALGLAMIARAAGDLDRARSLFEEAHADQHAKKAAATQLAALARAAGDLKAADRYEREVRAAKADPPWSDPLLDVTTRMAVGVRGRERRISELEYHERYAEAAEAYLKQIEEAPTAKAYTGAAVNLARPPTRDFARALSLMRKAIELEPDGVQTNYTLGLVLLLRAQQEEEVNGVLPREMVREAVARAKKAVEGKPDHGGACWVWGRALILLREPAEAIAPLRQGVASRPDDAELQLALGEALLATGRAKQAKTHLENARQLKPDDRRPGPLIERAQRSMAPNEPRQGGVRAPAPRRR